MAAQIYTMVSQKDLTLKLEFIQISLRKSTLIIIENTNYSCDSQIARRNPSSLFGKPKKTEEQN